MRRNQKGFTLMELMVVIVIVAILAAVAVPLYINYVRDASRTEAKGAIGAILTAEQTYYQQNQAYLAFGDADVAGWLTESDPSKRLNCDITEAQRNWSFTATGTTPATLEIKAAGRATVKSVAGLEVTYKLHPTTGANWEEK
jgi:type IV pilus assembly protein PilE